MREQWTSRAGFIVAAIGAAVGLGNIWRFSYVAGENGGGAFLLIYILAVIVIGLPLLIAELAIGRHSQGDAVTTFAAAAPKSPWRHVGWFGVIGAVIILSYYAVVAGWALKYFVGASTGSLWRAAQAEYGSYFQQFIASPGEPLAWQAAMMLATMVIVSGGVQRGIERLNAWIMPLLALIVLGLAAFALTLPGSGAGMRFLFAPDWSALTRPSVYVAALGQAFFSVGVGMAVYVTYGSYMGRGYKIPSSAMVIAFGDTLFALVAGLAIFPAVFALGGDPASGPKLAFITLPQIFLRMPGGELVGPVFFFLLSAAALTSMVSLLEVPVAFAAHRLKMRRWTAAAVIGGVIILLGVPSALSYGVLGAVKISGRPLLDAMDHAVSSYFLPLGGVTIALFVGWVVGRKKVVALADLELPFFGVAWSWLLRFVVPAMIILILLRSTGVF